IQGKNVTYVEHAHGPFKVDQSTHNYFLGESPKSIPLSLPALIETLERAYKAESRMAYMYSPEKGTDVCDSFINLAILTQRQVKEAEDPRRQPNGSSQLIDNRDLYYNSFEALYQAKEAIDLKDLFSPLNNEPAKKRILIEGRAGIGKTTFCKYIVNAWMDPKKRSSLLGWGKKFEVVIWIKLRELIQY